MALSYASPTEPIEGRTPASRQRWPNAIEVYWVDSIDRRNTIFVGLSGDTANGPRIASTAAPFSTMRVVQRGQA
jgi:hypothetical protein